MLELLFLMAFSLHNLEEAVWLPQWSKSAKKFHMEVGENEFRFAVIVVTVIGYLITASYLILGEKNAISKYIYFGFVMMMSMNAIFPHLLSSVILKTYSPGTITGCFLLLPIGFYIIFVKNGIFIFDQKFLLGFASVSIFMILILKPLFKIGKKIISY